VRDDVHSFEGLVSIESRCDLSRSGPPRIKHDGAHLRSQVSKDCLNIRNSWINEENL
jgi:hypothetical protein